jgi:hypothetical protein
MQISEKQLEANRANAQKSTGPRTEEGKARSAMNGFSNSFLGNLATIMTNEDRLAQAEFVRDYVADWKPIGAIERQMANVLAMDNWRLNRIKSVEENMFAWGHEVAPGIRVESDFEPVVNALTHANSFLVHAEKFNKLSLCESRLNRMIAKNTEQLLKRQADRRKNEALAGHEPKPSAQPLQHFTAANGFASMNPQTTSEPAMETLETIKIAA